jgi:hypothetical protein
VLAGSRQRWRLPTPAPISISRAPLAGR